MRPSSLRSTFVLAVLFGLAACGQPPSSAVSHAARPIIGGTSDTGDPGVALLVAQMSSGSASLCTCEVVSPHVVMSAAHCVDPAVVGTGNTFYVFFGPDVNTGGMSACGTPPCWIPVASTHYDTAFNPSNLTGGHDVSAEILSSPAPVTPLTMNTGALSNAADDGMPLRLVGYGVDSGSDTTGMSAGTKRQVTTTLGSLDDLFLYFGDATSNTCEGDSGGPAFLTIGGTEVIAGITSFGVMGCSMTSTDTRVDTQAAPFVQGYISMADPGWSPGMPPPPPPDAGTVVGPTPDAGIPGGPTYDAGVKNPGGAPLGGACTTDSDCASALCIPVAGGNVCSQSCQPTVSSSCPGNFSCAYENGQDACIADSALSTPSGGCSALPSRAPGTGTGWLAGALLLAIAGIALASRRRRRRGR